MGKFVTVKYDGSKQPEHLQKIYRIKTHELHHGKTVEIPARIAGMAKRTLGDSLTIVKGEPDYSEVLPATAKAAMKKNMEFREQYGADPAEALQSAPQLSEATVKLILGKPETLAEAIEAGKLDEEAAMVAMVLWLLGRNDAAKALARRMPAA